MRSSLAILKKLDWPLMAGIGMLSGFGLLMLWTIDLAKNPLTLTLLKRQLGFAGLGISLVFALSFWDYRAWRFYNRPLYWLGLLLLGGLFFFGRTIRGTTGWFVLGNFSFQPVEVARVFLMLTLARYFSSKAQIVEARMIIFSGLLVLPYLALLLAQPDLGSALVLLALWLGMLFCTKLQRRHLLIFMLIFIILSLSAWFFFLQDYQRQRIVSIFTPERDPWGQGYNLRQAVIAVGSGGLLGRGLGEGSQAQLRFLPEAHTDFIFAVLAEQLGFFGVVILLGIYAFLLLRLLAVAKTLPDGFALFALSGTLILWAVPLIINVGMNLGVLPIIGLPLPFVSYGGSALLGNFLLLGLMQSILMRR